MAKLGKKATKSISTEDKLLGYYYKTVEYYENNKNRVYTILTVLVVIIAVIFLYFKNKSTQNETAEMELGKVKQFYTAGSYDQAMKGDSLGFSKGLLYIVDNYGSTEGGQDAKVMLGNCYMYYRDFANAEKYYKDFSGSNEIFKATALAGLGAVTETKNAFLEAAKLYEKAAKVSKSITNNEEYLFYAIRDYSLAKDNENVKRIVKELKKDYPKSKFIAQIVRYDTGEN
jgi:tetratricopeptide (TPR) repeat protein